jgi:hypothetical protein
MLSTKTQILLKKSNVHVYLNQNDQQYIRLYKDAYEKLIIKYAKLSINKDNYRFDSYIYK